jgi:hypothetical protein
MIIDFAAPCYKIAHAVGIGQHEAYGSTILPNFTWALTQGRSERRAPNTSHIRTGGKHEND